MMKKLLLLIITLAYSLVVLSQLIMPYGDQSKKNEFYVTAGIGTVPFLVKSFNQYGFNIWGYYDEEVPEDHVWPVITLGYQYRVSKKFKIGAEIIYDKFLLYNKENSYRFFSVMARFNYKLGESKRFVAYSGISGGITFEHSIETEQGVKIEKNKTWPAIHLYLLEVDYKFKRFSITFTSGLGMSGIINLGMKYRF